MPVRSHVQHSGQSRQSHDRDYNNGDSSGSRPNSPTWRDDSGSEQRGRTSTDATPRPTPSHPRNLGSVVAHDTNSNILGSSSSAADFFSPSRRLALFGGGGDKGSSSHSHHQHNSSTSSLATARGHITAAHLLPPRSHSRAESALALNREASASPIPSISGTSMASSSTVTAAKAHTSPSKVSLRTSCGVLLYVIGWRNTNICLGPSVFLSPPPLLWETLLQLPESVLTSLLPSRLPLDAHMTPIL